MREKEIGRKERKIGGGGGGGGGKSSNFKFHAEFGIDSNVQLFGVECNQFFRCVNS